MLAAIYGMTACSVEPETPDTISAEPRHTDAIAHGYNELADAGKRETFTISDYNADNEAVENIPRPAASTVRTQLDTTLLFDTWVIDPDAPHAAFALSARSFYVVDYDGDGDMPYELNGQHLKIYYNDFIQEGEIISVSADSLNIRWQGNTQASSFVRWSQ